MAHQFINKAITGILITGTWGIAGAQQALFENHLELDRPQVDATAVWNTGTISVFSTDPWSTLNTLNFTNDNSGRIEGSPGFKFDYSTTTMSFPSDSFVNRGVIDAGGGFGGFFGGGFFGVGDGGVFFGGGSFVDVSSESISSSGYLKSTPDGRVTLEGTELDLSRGSIRANNEPGTAPGSGFVDHQGLEYSAAPGVSENYWGVGSSQNYVGSTAAGRPLDLALLSLPEPASPNHQVNFGNFTNDVSIQLTDILGGPDIGAFVWTNAVSATQAVVQVVFVRTNFANPEFSVEVAFADNTQNASIAGTKAAVLRWGLSGVDTITKEGFTNYVYLEDSLATLTNATLYTNAFNASLFRPNNYNLYRGGTPFIWAGGEPANSSLDDVAFEGADFAAASPVTNIYSGYSGNFATGGGGSFGGGGFGAHLQYQNPTNMAGRVEIKGEHLDMDLTRIDAAGFVQIEAEHFEARREPDISSPFLSLKLASTNGMLSLADIIADKVVVLDGTVGCYSAVWTNTTITNDTRLEPEEYRFHVLIVDAQIGAADSEDGQPVSVVDLNLTADEIEFSDVANVSDNLLIDAERFTNNGEILLTPLSELNYDGAWDDEESRYVWGVGLVDQTHFPRLKEFTNNGILSTPDGIWMGALWDVPLDMFANYGSLSSGAGLWLDAEEIFLAGALDSTVTPMNIRAGTLLVEEASLAATGNVNITAANASFAFSIIDANASFFEPSVDGAIVLDVTGDLSDDGPLSFNQWSTTDGFRIVGQRPASGDLSGTSIVSNAEAFELVQHVWAGDDLGPSEAGFSNNLALQTLTLQGGLYSTWAFSGLGENDALYVDFLEINGVDVEALADAFEFADNFRLYFHESSPIPAEELDGMFDGRLVWVPRSDEGGDGGDTGTITAAMDSAGSSVALTWTAAAGATYRIEACDDIAEPVWVTVDTVTNAQGEVASMSYSSDLGDGAIRFFRAVLVD